jgi:hypothetical protein
MKKKPKGATSVGENEMFVTLVRAAQEDKRFGRQIAGLVSLPSFQRRSLLGSMVEQMTLRGADAGLIAACAALRSDHVAEKLGGLLPMK